MRTCHSFTADGVSKARRQTGEQPEQGGSPGAEREGFEPPAPAHTRSRQPPSSPPARSTEATRQLKSRLKPANSPNRAIRRERRGRDLNPSHPPHPPTTTTVLGCRRLHRGNKTAQITAEPGRTARTGRFAGERRGRDLNPRGGSTPPTRLAGERLRPLGHLSSPVRVSRPGQVIRGVAPVPWAQWSQPPRPRRLHPDGAYGQRHWWSAWPS